MKEIYEIIGSGRKIIENTSIGGEGIKTIKKVDKDTSYNLYDRIINPLGIFIMPSYKNKGLFDMKLHLYSIDDSSYGAWFNKKSKEELLELRIILMNWLDTQKILNGEYLIKTCILLGAKQIDYN